jgi:hypothetical protein
MTGDQLVRPHIRSHPYTDFYMDRDNKNPVASSHDNSCTLVPTHSI